MFQANLAARMRPLRAPIISNPPESLDARGPKKEDGKYEWESEVQYWMPFVGNLVGLHDASWQPSSVFSNPDAYKTYGSHGCVNLPTDKAAEIYGIIQNGDPVIVHW